MVSVGLAGNMYGFAGTKASWRNYSGTDAAGTVVGRKRRHHALRLHLALRQKAVEI